MTSAQRHRLGELARLRRIAANAELTPFERETAALALADIEQGPVCKYCLVRTHDHGGAVCPVIARHQRRQGKGSFPTDGQAEELRQAIIADGEAADRKAEKRRAAERQGRLF
jgi:hypothetical protein